MMSQSKFHMARFFTGHAGHIGHSDQNVLWLWGLIQRPPTVVNWSRSGHTGHNRGVLR